MVTMPELASSSPVIRGSFDAFIFIASLFILERSSDVFVDSTAIVAKRLSLPTVLVGLLTAGAEWEEVSIGRIFNRSSVLILSWVTQLAVVVSSLAKGNSDLALSNVYGSFVANILGSFSIGLLFNPARLEGREHSSARIYTSLLLALSIGIAILSSGLGNSWLTGEQGKMHGRIVGGLLITVFTIYVGGISWGIYRGAIIASEDSDSDSDSDSNSDAGSVNEANVDVEREASSASAATVTAEGVPPVNPEGSLRFS